MTDRKLVAALACRNNGSRLYGKPLQNLDIEKRVRILDVIIDNLKALDCVEDVVLGIAEGNENLDFQDVADQHGIQYIIGKEDDVLGRLIACGEARGATDVLRVTSESPFLYYEPVNEQWEQHVAENRDATLFDHVIDGCGFEFLSIEALRRSHQKGEHRHRSESCSLFIRENPGLFRAVQVSGPEALHRRDLRLTVDYPEDLVLCRAVYQKFKHQLPRVAISDIVAFLDQNKQLVQLTAPFTETGYETMFVWNDGND